MEPGIYILILTGESAEIGIGALGLRSFSAGYHAYVGSALGPGGLTRVSRHIRFSKARNRNPRWHIDYLLSDARFRLNRVYCGYTKERFECLLAGQIPLQVIPGFGSSDCCCNGHLFWSPDDPDPEVQAAFRNLGLDLVVHKLPSEETPGDGGTFGNV